jgi:hypothetical protein
MVRVDVPDPGAQFAYVHAAEAVAQDVDLSARRVLVGAEQAEQGGLAGAVGAEQGPVLALAHGEGHVVEQRPALAHEPDILGAQHVRPLRGHRDAHRGPGYPRHARGLRLRGVTGAGHYGHPWLR